MVSFQMLLRSSRWFHGPELVAHARKVHMDRPGARVAPAQGVTRTGGGNQFAFGRLQSKAFSGDGHAASEGDAVIVLEYIFLYTGRLGLRRHCDRGQSIGRL